MAKELVAAQAVAEAEAGKFMADAWQRRRSAMGLHDRLNAQNGNGTQRPTAPAARRRPSAAGRARPSAERRATRTPS